MIVDQTGKPMTTQATAKAVVFVSADGEVWEPVHGYNVPEWLRDPDTMAHLIDGEILSIEEEGPYYKAQRTQ